MPAVHETYPCHVCEKTHALHLDTGAVPDLDQQLYYISPDERLRGADNEDHQLEGNGVQTRSRDRGDRRRKGVQPPGRFLTRLYPAWTMNGTLPPLDREAKIVAAVLHSCYCAACAGRHKVCFPDDDTIYSNREYEYECPSTRRAVRVPKGIWSEPDEDCPGDAILLREVKP